MRIEETLFVVVGGAAIVAFLVSFVTAGRRAPEIHVYMEPQEPAGNGGCAVLIVLVLFILLALATT